MNVGLEFNNSPEPQARYLGWAPSPCRARVTDPAGVTGSSVTVTLAARSAPGGGAVGFAAPGGGFATTLTLTLPAAGGPVPFFAAGGFGRPSARDGDVAVEVWRGPTRVESVPVMVRVRKDAEGLTPGERDRFLAALGRFNNRGMGRYADFRDMHTAAATREAHEAAGFAPWHRVFLLDLERELQAIDPAVTVPYWRFDRPAPSLFTRDFLGESDATGTVRFRPGHPLEFWQTDGVVGIVRSPRFAANQSPFGVRTEGQTLARGGRYADFRLLEGNPHGTAHTSFGGMIASLPTAVQDPLFFLLHANVDRLWAKWQWNGGADRGRFDPAVAAAYDTDPGGNRVGHNLADTMWPWNGVTGGFRPPTAPGGGVAPSPCAPAPSPAPAVWETLDYQGAVVPGGRLGYDYDDVPY